MKKLITLTLLALTSVLHADDVFVKASGQIARGNNPDQFSDTNLYVWQPSYWGGRSTVLAVPAIFRTFDGTNVREMTTAEKDALDIDATGLRQAKLAEILAKTQSLVDNATFVWETNTYGLGLQYKINWLGIALADEKGILSFPVIITDLSNAQHQLDDSADVTSFFGASVASVQALWYSDDTMIDQVNLATDWSGLQAVVDNR
jgi:hypothetical protein